MKQGDIIKILKNRLQPNTVGKIGTIVKTYVDDEGERIHKICLAGCKTPLKGYAEECCLSLAKHFVEYKTGKRL